MRYRRRLHDAVFENGVVFVIRIPHGAPRGGFRVGARVRRRLQLLDAAQAVQRDGVRDLPRPEELAEHRGHLFPVALGGGAHEHGVVRDQRRVDALGAHEPQHALAQRLLAGFDARAQRAVEHHRGLVHPRRVARLVQKRARAVAVPRVAVSGDEHGEGGFVCLDVHRAHLAAQRLHVAQAPLPAERGEHGVVRGDVAAHALGGHALEDARRLAVARRAHRRREQRVVHARVHLRARRAQRLEGDVCLLPLPALAVRADQRRVHQHGGVVVGERRAHLRERALRQAPLVRARQRSHHLVVRARVRRHARRRAVVAHLQKQAARLDVRRRPRALARAERGVVERQRQRAGARRLRRLAVQGVAGIAQPAQRVQRAVRVAAVRRALQRARRAGEALALAPLGAHALEEVVVAAPAAVLARGPHVVPGGEAPGRLGEEGGVFGSRAERAARAALVLA